jgi:ribose transport system substrate-binding protein
MVAPSMAARLKFSRVKFKGVSPWKDPLALGMVGAQWLAEEMDGKGNVVVLEGMSIPINKQRVDAFNEVMKGFPDIKILDSQPADWSTQKALRLMENYL